MGAVVQAATSQLIVRNQELLQQGRWLIVNAEEGALFTELEYFDLYGFHQYVNTYNQISTQQKHKHYFGAEYPSPEATCFDGALMVLPKAKAHAQMLLANIANLLKPGATLLVVGENAAGGKSAGKLLSPYGEQVTKQDAARHCSLFSVVLTEPVDAFSLDSYLFEFTVSVADTQLTAVSLPGVFSHKELDAGTRLLLDNIALVPTGRLLDFACGCGVIGTYLGLKNTNSKLVMCDVSALALYCAQRTAALNDVAAEYVASDGLNDIEGKFNGIYTNPPFHSGVKTDYGITQKMLTEVKQHLRKPGKLWLVANRFLKYPDHITQQLGNCTTVAQTSKFNLYRAVLG